MADRVTYETRIETSGGEGPRFKVDQFAGWFARWEALFHARKLVKRGEAKVATVFRVKRIGAYWR